MSLELVLRVANGVPDPVLFISAEGTILGGNRSVTRAGLSLDTLQGRRIQDVAHAGSGSLSSLLQSWFRSSSPLPSVLTFPAMSPEPLRCYGSLIEPAQGGSRGLAMLRLSSKANAVAEFRTLNEKITALTAEIHHRREAERQLARERSQLETTLQCIGDGVIVTDAAGRVRTLNPIAESLTGWTLEEAQGRLLHEVFPIFNEYTRAPVENPVEKVLSTGRIVGLANHTLLLAKDGTTRPIDDSAAPIRDVDGSLHGVVLIFRDITEQKQWLRELEATNTELAETDRRKDEFLAMLAHELRNPLAPLLSGLELLERDPRQVNVLRTAKRQVVHLVRIVDDLLDVSRILRNKITLAREPISIQEVVHRALADVAGAVASRQHALILDLPEDAVWVEGDAVRLVQTFSNLLGNAVKYTPPGGTITVSAGVDGQEIQIRIRDNGVGIGAELLPHVFDLFTQAQQTVDRSEGGLGIGLTVVRNLVELHGGRIEAHSKGRGQGSEFVVILPRGAPHEQPTPLLDHQAERSRPCRILLVDDNEAAAELLALLLQSIAAHDIRIALDGPSALEMAQTFLPDLVILDIGLPGMDGYEVARKIRANPRLDAPVLAALTGYGSSEDRRRAFEAGFDFHYVKPLSLEKLVELLGATRNED